MSALPNAQLQCLRIGDILKRIGMAAIEKRKSNDELSSMRTSEGTRAVKSRCYRRRKYLPLVEFIDSRKPSFNIGLRTWTGSGLASKECCQEFSIIVGMNVEILEGNTSWGSSRCQLRIVICSREKRHTKTLRKSDPWDPECSSHVQMAHLDTREESMKETGQNRAEKRAV